MSPIEERTQPAASSRGLPAPPVSLNDPPFNFKIEALVDADDSGFDTDNDSDSDASLSETDDTKYHGYSSTDATTTTNGTDEADDDLRIEDDHCIRELDESLRKLTCQLQSEFLKQVKSTQIILIHEVSQIYKSYQDHGSAARLSASITAFLDSGDVATRPAKHPVEEDVVDSQGRKTGYKKMVEKKVIERAKVHFLQLPEMGVSALPIVKPKEELELRSSVGGKRKASVGTLQGANDRVNGPVGGFGPAGTPVGAAPLSFRTKTSPERPKTAGKQWPDHKVDAMDLDKSTESELYRRPQYQYHFGNMLTRSGPIHQQARPHAIYVSAPPEKYSSGLIQFQSLQTQPGLHNHSITNLPPPQQPPTFRLQPSQPSFLNNLANRQRYTLTTDSETQSLLLDTTNPIPSNPLSALNLPLTLPKPAETSPPYPELTLPTINTILCLHAHSAAHFYHSLIDKYTIQPTASDPTPPQPPAALFQLGIMTRLKADLKDMFTVMMEHELALAPRVRALLKDVHTRLGPGGRGGSGRSTTTASAEESADGREAGVTHLNRIEAEVLAKAGGIDRDSVELWWEERAKDNLAWDALCTWVGWVEVEKIREAKVLGRY